MSTPTPEEKKAELKAFEDVFERITEEFIKDMESKDFPKEAVAWARKMIFHTVPGGKMNRGLSVVDSFKILCEGKPNDTQLFKARVLGWCVEWLQAFFLVADDIMDQSITRRGKQCWYRVKDVANIGIKEVGNIAINDSLILESAIYFFLRRYFRQDPCYADLLELFHEVTLQTEYGQLLDLITAPEDNVDLSKFSIERHRIIVEYKTAFYSFYLPVSLGMRLAGITNELAYEEAKKILIPLGTYFQCQDDFLDCYGAPEVIGKIGTDIEDNKCSWLINQALMRASPEQRKKLEENYGKKNADNVAVVKSVFKELDLESVYKRFEEDSYRQVNALINELDESVLKRDVFVVFVKKIYKRSY